MAGSASLPSADDFFGAPPKPSAEQFFGAPVAAPPPTPKPIVAAAPPAAKPTAAQFFGTTARNVMADWRDRAQAGAGQFMEGARQFAPGDGQSADPLNAGKGMLKMVGGGTNWLLSPISGAADALVGRPVDRATQNAPRGHVGPVPYDLHIPKTLAGDYVEQVAPFLAPGAGAAREPRSFKPTAREFFAETPEAPTAVKPSAEEFFGLEKSKPTVLVQAEDPQANQAFVQALEAHPNWRDDMTVAEEGELVKSEPELMRLATARDTADERRAFEGAAKTLEAVQGKLPDGWTAKRVSAPLPAGTDAPGFRHARSHVYIFNKDDAEVGAITNAAQLDNPDHWFNEAIRTGDERSVHQQALDDMRAAGGPVNDGPMDDLAHVLAEIGQTPPPKGRVVTADEFFGPVLAAKDDPYDDILYAPRKAGTLSLPQTAEAAQPRGVKEAMADAAGAVQNILAPATVGQGRDAAATIRRASAESDLLAAQSAQALVKHAAKVSELSVPEQRGLVAYIEGRSSGARLADPGLQKTADAIRNVNTGYRDRIEQVMGLDEGPSFIRDYYTHLWKESPDVVENRILSTRQGSGKNLKARSIPTVQEGIEAGLTPVTENPIEATMMYASNMSKYLSTVDVQKELADSTMSKWASPGQQPVGWVPLQGIRTEKAARTIIQDGETSASLPGQKLFAPPDVARVYNNWISSGFDRGDTAPLFSPIRKAVNGVTMLKLGLSAFHATTMAQEAVISELARGIQAGTRGDVVTAAKAIGGAPGAFIGRAVRGGRMRAELLGMKPAEGLSAKVNDAFIRAGGRVRMDPLLRTRGVGSFYNTIHNGTWKAELKQTANNIFGKDRLMSERAAGVVDLGANLIQSTAAPLFESYIPRLKQGAFASNMEDWLKANPAATQKAIDEAAHLINRSIDNRFGEMAWDNLFWHRWLKQASQILLLSPTWNLGTINEIGGGLLDMLGPSAKGVMTGKGVTQRTAYVAALASFVPLINGMMTYLKTGQAPHGMDFLAYRTGGSDASTGQPERGLLPGYQKDVYAFGYDFPNHIGEEVANKLNPALKTVMELGANKDFRDLPIRDTNAPLTDQAKQTGDYLLDAFMPISLGQLAKGRKRGSNLSPAERAAAVRPAPMYLTAPDELKRIKQGQARNAWRRRTRADARAQNRRED